MYTLHTRFCTFGADLYARSVLINKIFASELGRKFVKSALLVGHAQNTLLCVGYFGQCVCVLVGKGEKFNQLK